MNYASLLYPTTLLVLALWLGESVNDSCNDSGMVPVSGSSLLQVSPRVDPAGAGVMLVEDNTTASLNQNVSHDQNPSANKSNPSLAGRSASQKAPHGHVGAAGAEPSQLWDAEGTWVAAAAPLKPANAVTSGNTSTFYFLLLTVVAFTMVKQACKEEKTENLQRVEAWTGFRWALASSIFLEHHSVHPVSGSGAFLLLSGGVLSLSKRQVTSLDGYISFVGRRVSRVYPAYWFAISAYLANSEGVTFVEAFTSLPTKHPGIAIGLQPWMPDSKANRLWFIGAVIQLYCLFPLLSLGLSRLGTLRSVKTGVAVAIVCYAAQWFVALLALHEGYGAHGSRRQAMLHFKDYDLPLYANPIFRLPQFILGVVMGHLSQTMTRNSTEWTLPGWVVDACSTAVVGMLAAWRCFALSRFYAGRTFADFFLESPVVFLLLLGLAVSPEPSCTSALFTWKPIHILGKWSYGIYLWQPFLNSSGLGWAHGSLWGIVSEYSFCVVVSALSFKFVEEPAQSLANKIFQDSKATPPVFDREAEVPVKGKMDMRDTGPEAATSSIG